MTASGASREEGVLLQFLYMMPIGVIDFDGTGSIRIVNPAAVNLLAPTVGISNLDNVFVEFTEVWPELASLVDSGDALGPLVVDHRLDSRGAEPAWSLSIEVVKVAADRYMMTVSDVTQIAAAEAASARSLAEAASQRSLLTDLIDSSPVGIGLFDADLRCMQINDALAEVNGVAAAETIGRHPSDFIPDLWPLVERHFLDGLHRPRLEIELEGETAAQPGVQRWWLTNYFPVTLGPNRNGVAVMVVDITDRKETELRLAESENRFRDLSNASPLLVWEHDVDGNRAWVNETCCAFFGADRDEILAEHWQMPIHPDDASGYDEAFAVAVASCGPFHQTFRVRRADGEWRWLESWANPRLNSEGRCEGHVGTSADVTDRVESHRQVAEAAAFTGRVLDNLFSFAGVLDTDGTVIDVNNAPLEVAGLSLSEVVGRPFWECYWWDHSAEDADELRLALGRAAAGEVVRYDVHVRVLDGALLPIDFQVAPLRDTAGSVTHLVVSGLDLSERAELERLNREARWRAETLESTATRLAVATTVADVAAVMVDAASTAGPAVLYLVTSNGLQRVAATEAPDTIPLDMAGPLADVVTGGDYLVIDPPEIVERFPLVADDIGAAAAVSAAVIPCRAAGGEVLGVLSVTSFEREWFTAERLSLLEAFAAQAAGALERAMLFEREQLARRRSEGTARLLVELDGAGTPEAQYDAVVDHLLDELADYATIEVPGRVLAARHTDPDRVQDPLTYREIDELAAIWAAPPGAGTSHVSNGVGEPSPADVATESDPSTLPKPLDRHARMVVAIDLGVGVRGAILVGRVGSDAAFTQGDLAHLEQLAARIGVALAAGRVRHLEHDVSLRLQRALLPDSIRWDPRVPIEARYQAAGDMLEVGGDWYDTFTWPDGHIGAMVGDVVGHDIDSGAAMGRLRAATAAMATRCGPNPSELLEALDRFARSPDGVAFATAVCVVVDPHTGTLTYAAAGHPPAIVVTPDHDVIRLDQALTPPLGVFAAPERRSATIQLPPASVVLMYTDGLIERRDESLDHSIRRLEQSARDHAELPLPEIAERLVFDATTLDPANDDIVVVCLRYTPIEAELTQHIVADRGRLDDHQAELEAWLTGLGVDRNDRRDVLLTVGEAVDDAIAHADRDLDAGTIDVRYGYHREHVTAEITDRGLRRDPSTPSSRDRGTMIMERLANRFERTVGETGTVVSLTLHLGRSARGER